MIFKKRIQLICLFYTLINLPLITAAQSPGGVSSNFRLWLRADAGTSTTTNNSSVNQWNDQSGNARNATQATALRQPVYKNNSTDNMNFNPVVDFTATSNSHFTIPNSVLPAGTGAFSIYIVSRKNSNNGMTMLGLGTSVNNQSINVGTENNGTGRFHTWNNAWSPASGAIVSGAVIQSSFNFQSAVRYLSVNSVSHGSSGASISLVPGGAYIGANHSSPTASNFEGEISEVIVYAENSSVANKLRIESYLSMKYGITKTGNYVNSAGAVIWDATANSTYHNNVAIIGRDDGSSLNQKQSISTNTGFQPIISNGSSLFASNIQNTNNFSANQSFIAWGSTTGTTNFATAFMGGSRMNRIWKVAKSGTVGTVKVAVKASDVPGVNYLHLLISNDATIDNSDTRHQMSSETINGINYFTTEVTLNNGQFFSFMSSNTTLPVVLTHFGVKCLNDYASISWETAMEKNSSYFLVQKSDDGISWSELTRVDAVGNSNHLNHYTASELQPATKYYRLIQYDLDGKYYASPIVLSDCQNVNGSLNISPNPGRGRVNIAFLTHQLSNTSTLRLRNMSGEVVHEQALQVTSGQVTYDLDITNFKSGMYMMEVSDESGKVHQTKYLIE